MPADTYKYCFVAILRERKRQFSKNLWEFSKELTYDDLKWKTVGRQFDQYIKKSYWNMLE